MGSREPVRMIVGAFDRHNFGDLLLGHLALEAETAMETVLAGVVSRDLRYCGGHRVAGLRELARRLGDRPVHVIHAGGELLDCDAWEAGVMTLSASEAPAVIARFDLDERERLAWARHATGLDDLVPYCVSPALLGNACSIEYRAVGGVALARRPEAFRQEVLRKLEQAHRVGVRDRVTRALLAQAGIRTELEPDPVTALLPRFSSVIERHANQGEVMDVRARFPGGYVVAQFSADFGDDATLRLLAEQLEQIHGHTGWGLVLFRAGAAPWHDSLEVYRGLARFLPKIKPLLFSSLHVWDICALISRSRAYCGSSLHGRLVAHGHGIPSVSLVRGDALEGKVVAYWQTWHGDDLGSLATVGNAANALLQKIAQ